MRKNYTVLLMFFVLLGIGCTKSNNTTIETEQVETKTRTQNETIVFNGVDYQISNGMLHFLTFDHYEQLFTMKDLNKLYEFANQVNNAEAMISYVETITDVQKKHELGFVGNIINEQGFIKIDVYTLLLDFTSRKVFATRYGNTNDLLSAKNGTQVTNVHEFSMDENDVIEELRDMKTRGIFCKDRWAESKNLWTDPELITKYAVLGIPRTLQANVRYSKGGIYFELQTESYCPQWAMLGGSENIKRNLNWNYSWIRRCGKSESGSGSSSNTQSIPAITQRFFKVVYGNPRALKHYYLSATITSPNSAIPGDSRTVTITD